LGGIPRLSYCSDEELMQIPDEIRKCVAFIASQDKTNAYTMRGTVFLVGYPLPLIEDTPAYYLVTARHTIDQFLKRDIIDTHLRFNARNSNAQYVSIPTSQWLFNEDDRIDVAVLPIDLNLSEIDHKYIPLNLFVNPEIINSQQIGVGDDIFFPGLFSKRFGDRKNIPIIRIGNIAAMPEESIQTEWGTLPSAYLIEARSIGGLSGSPVIFSTGQTRKIGNMFNVLGQAQYYLLGLIHGHYGIKDEMWDSADNTFTDDSRIKSINMGIAMVIPSWDILSTLDRPELKQKRKLESDAKMQERAASTVLDNSFFTSINVMARTNDITNGSNSDQKKDSMSKQVPPMNP
jgi:hypothetical protein